MVTWDEYFKLCGKDDRNTVPDQLKCAALIGSSVVWTGTFKAAKVTKIENSVEPLLKGMPGFIADYFKCSYGQEYGDCNDPSISESDKEICTMMTSLGHECHLQQHNTYSFALEIQMETFKNGIMSISAGHNFKETLTALVVDDVVEFSATLIDGAGSLTPQFKLKNIKCMNRQLNIMAVIEENDEDIIFRSMNEALSVGFNFFWYPLVEYLPHKGFLAHYGLDEDSVVQNK